ncbi:DMT family transporter [Acidaminobacter sp.]|uniref:DMT family transporter n=1 Tax=Acidaminobacter sp. TaxID=1872102 RepID=UPI001385DA42|nr:DMT family transporter [Acidaminobacter sp.]MDK9709853.1 DMT family transporter [Acidaminobacter sp.]MZQ96638.1 EamA family transporter [Acidaminobacter sp.]
MKLQRKADLALIMVVMFWGTSNLLTKVGLGDLSEFNLIALRFVIAFALTAVIFRRRLAAVDLITVKRAAMLSVILFCVFIFATFGVRHTTVSNAGFLTCLSGIIVPMINFAVFKIKQDKLTVISILMALAGVWLLIAGTSLTFNLGDILCILCSVAFAVHILVTERLTRDVDSVALGVIQLGFVGVYAVVFSFMLETPTLPVSVSNWMVVLGLSVFSTAIAFVTQTVAQKYTTATHTGLIFTFEPLFSVLIAYIFLGEILSLRGYAGAVLMLASLLLIELKPDFRKVVS